MSRWFRFYDEALNDQKVQTLAPELFKAWVNLLCLASKNGGTINSASDAAFALRTSEAKAIAVVASLAAKGLMDKIEGGYFAPHNWNGRQYKSDVSTNRVRDHRERLKQQAGNVSSAVSGTPPETEQNRTEQITEQNGAFARVGLSFGREVKKGWTPPRHGARGNGRIYLQVGTEEWAAYAADFRATQNQDPLPNAHGGKWFKLLGEAS